MSNILPSEVENLIEQFQRLPGVGPKSAARMAYHYLRGAKDQAIDLADALQSVAQNVTHCQKCYNVSNADICPLCADKQRDQTKLCIVEEPLDVLAFEQAGIYDGLYFVLGGVISPADGIHPEELRFTELKERVAEMLSSLKNRTGASKHPDKEESESGQPEDANTPPLEIIIATNPSLEGETTATYIKKLLAHLEKSGEVKITRIAMGLPSGVDLEFADRLTLKRALEGRQ